MLVTHMFMENTHTISLVVKLKNFNCIKYSNHSFIRVPRVAAIITLVFGDSVKREIYANSLAFKENGK